MNYELYTAPRCDDCMRVKSFLEGQNVKPNIIDLTDLYHDKEAKKTYGSVIMGLGKKLERTTRGQAILPLLIKRDLEGNIIGHAQKYDNIVELLSV